MGKIVDIHGREILDSRGFPTIKVEVITDDGITGRAAVPSGASKGEHEAVELHDNDPKRYQGKGVLRAVGNVNGPLAQLLKGWDVFDQVGIDQEMIKKDGTENKRYLGANAILAVSLAVARAGAMSKKIPLFKYISTGTQLKIPIPMMNILNGGVHADNSLNFQEFMIRPIGAPNFSEALRYGVEVFHALKTLLKQQGHITSVGDEGGFAPNLSSDEEAFDLIIAAIEKVGLRPRIDISLGIDCAASAFYQKDKKVYYNKKQYHRGQRYEAWNVDRQIDYLEKLVNNYPIDSIEDGLDQNDWEGWKLLTSRLGRNVQIIGDDIFVTNPRFLIKGINSSVGNAIIIKGNQIGTLTETIDTIQLAKQNNYATIISHRSGETEDTFIADLAVATCAGQIKTGSLSRSERIAKYNRLLAIDEMLSIK